MSEKYSVLCKDAEQKGGSPRQSPALKRTFPVQTEPKTQFRAPLHHRYGKKVRFYDEKTIDKSRTVRHDGAVNGSRNCIRGEGRRHSADLQQRNRLL